MGRQEAPEDRGHAPPDVDAPGAKYGLRSAGSRGPHHRVPAASGARAPGSALIPMTAPNGTWTADFKGQFKTRNGVYCYPLTIVDGFSRTCSAATACSRPRSSPPGRFRRLFQEYGLPGIIRTDNGVPFATTALGRLSTLSSGGFGSGFCRS